MKRALITGITGQDGYYLRELLLSKGYQVHGIVKRDTDKNKIQTLIKSSTENSNLILHYGDLINKKDWIDLLKNILPNEIYNLGAQSQVKQSFLLPEETCNITGLGILRILEAIKELNLIDKVRVFQASSSEMFGNVVESPQFENTAFHPRSPYGCAKVMAHYLTINYRELYNMYACSGILYNHESPQRNEIFVTRKITKAAARIKLGLQDTLQLGNLKARRDWGYAKDYVQAMWLMLQQNEATDFVIASGATHSVQEFVEMAFKFLDLDWQEYVKYDVKEERFEEKNFLQGNASKIKEKLGWVAHTTFKELVEMMVAADYAFAEKELCVQVNQVQR